MIKKGEGVKIKEKKIKEKIMELFLKKWLKLMQRRKKHDWINIDLIKIHWKEENWKNTKFNCT